VPEKKDSEKRHEPKITTQHDEENSAILRDPDDPLYEDDNQEDFGEGQ